MERGLETLKVSGILILHQFHPFFALSFATLSSCFNFDIFPGQVRFLSSFSGTQPLCSSGGDVSWLRFLTMDRHEDNCESKHLKNCILRCIFGKFLALFLWDTKRSFIKLGLNKSFIVKYICFKNPSYFCGMNSFSPLKERCVLPLCNLIGRTFWEHFIPTPVRYLRIKKFIRWKRFKICNLQVPPSLGVSTISSGIERKSFLFVIEVEDIQVVNGDMFLLLLFSFLI